MNQISVPASSQTPDLQQALLQLRGCGFQPLGMHKAQGSTGEALRALSADGSAWLEIRFGASGLSGGLRRLWESGALRGAGGAAQCTSMLSDRSLLVTTTALQGGPAGALLERLPPGTSLRQLAHHHLQRLDETLWQQHPLRVLIMAGAGDIEAALRQVRPRRAPLAPRPLNPESLLQLGVAPHLARLIAGAAAAPELARL